jgi:hypothetical protein
MQQPSSSPARTRSTGVARNLRVAPKSLGRRRPQRVTTGASDPKGWLSLRIDAAQKHTTTERDRTAEIIPTKQKFRPRRCILDPSGSKQEIRSSRRALLS